MNEIHLLIEGRVQHVGFRRFVLRHAELFNLSGWVRNNEDGSVEVLAIGDAKSISDFTDACRKGPLFSHVFNVQFLPVTEQDRALHDPTFFKVLYD